MLKAQWHAMKRWFQDKTGIGENRDKLVLLEKKLNMLHALVQQMDTETLALQDFYPKFLSEHPHIKPDSLAIHKNDLMFLYPLYHHNGQMQVVFEEYMRTGLETAQLLQKWWGSVHAHPPQTVLDFGSGYGRVSRFLPIFFDTSEIWVSEIKPMSLAFLENNFGFRTLLHNHTPTSFNPAEKFDLIFAGSVFTHLNSKDFAAWLEVLIKNIQPSGMLIITTHNQKNIGTMGGFHFVPHAEDFVLPGITDSLTNNKSYGTAYVGDSYLQKLFQDMNLLYTTKPLAFGGTQDVHLLQLA